MQKIKFKFKPQIGKIIALIFIIIFLIIFFLLYSKKVSQQPQAEIDPLTSAYLQAYGNIATSSNVAPSAIVNSINAPDPAPIGFSETVPILMYHYIEIPTATTTLPGLYLKPSIFEEQLKTLQANNYKTLFISELARDLRSEKQAGSKKIVLTFDDGYEDFYTLAWPILKKYNAKATLYVIINKLGAKGYLTREQVKELAASGLVEIASHTFNHPDLRALKKKDANFEIQASKNILENISGKPVLSFAYPFGYYKTDFFSVASSTGYLAAVSVIPGAKQGVENIWLLRRLRPGERTGDVFLKWLADWEQARF